MPETAQEPNAAMDNVPDLFRGPGEARARMRECDWDATPIGPPNGWPSSLLTIVRVMLTSHFAMWMAWGPDLIFFCNDAYLPTVGLKRNWVIGSRSDKVWAEIWPDIGPRIHHVLTTGEATWDEALLLYLERSGFAEETYHTFSYSPIADDAGNTSGMLCVVAEVTERVIGERQLRVLRDVGTTFAATSTRAETLSGLESCLSANTRDVPFALIYLLDQEGTPRLEAACEPNREISSASQRFIRLKSASWPLAKATSGELVRVEIDRIIPDWSSLDQQPYLPETRLPVSPREALIAPITDSESSDAVGYLVAGLNPHRQFDSTYQGFIELLTAQVAAAIARADEYERAHERELALTEIDRAKTAFFSNVSHEFRTPLTLMLGPLEDALAAAPLVPPEQRDRMAIAHRNALRLLRLVNSLLDFSRIEAGRVEATYRPTDLAALTADLAASFRSATDKAGLNLIVDTPALSQAVYVDHEMWEKIVLNLISNAFKFTFEGEIEVTLREREGTAQLTVRDTGTGIPGDQIEKLFDRFYRVEGASGRSFEGSGIGLALVRELVKLHYGDIEVESEEGQGSAFHVKIPLGAAHLPTDRVKMTSKEGRPATQSRTFVEEALRWLPGDARDFLLDGGAARGMSYRPSVHESSDEIHRVLLADDNADLRDYIGRLLIDHGYDVEAVADGKAAIAALRARRPDILVTDVMMPRLDGFGLLRAIRNDADLRELPIVMLSARAGDDAKVVGLEAGADDYLTKPFSARELLARVGANIKMAKLRREASNAIIRLNETLEQQVAERTAELMAVEESLRQSQKMEAVGQLTGGLAHDFNNLLTGISGSLELVEARIAQGRFKELDRYIHVARGAAKRAAALTHRLLAFSRRQTLDPKPTDMNRLVAEMDDLVRRTVGPSITIEVVKAAGLWPTLVDPNQLESALLNLCINARDAMPDGGRLTIETANRWLDLHAAKERDLPAGQYISLCVSDTGTGMTPEVIERAFDPFFTTKPMGEGTGLGLSMIYGFVRQSGGQARIYSEIGKGTMVCLYLPRLFGETTDIEPMPEITDQHRSSDGETVLVVDDEPSVRMLITEVLEELGYNALEAEDGPAGLKVLEGPRRIDLLITDVGLPGGMNGRQLADAALRTRPELKVLFITGYAENAVIGDGHLKPGIHVLTKPFALESLAARIQDIIID